MKLRTVSTKTVLGAMRELGTRDAVVRRVERRLNGECLVATDSKWTVVLSGGRVGVAKRCTYARRSDEYDRDTGLAVAASRL
jgi:hypothetical protein